MHDDTDDKTDNELAEMSMNIGVEYPRQPSEQGSSRADSPHHKSSGEANTTIGTNGFWTNISLLVRAKKKEQGQQVVQAKAAARTAAATAPQESPRAESSHHKSDDGIWTGIEAHVKEAQRQQVVQAMAAARTAAAASPQQVKQRQQVLQAVAAAALPVEWRREAL